MDFSQEFEFQFSRSSGAGGQHVNKVNTKAELRFNLNESQVLSPDQKERIRQKIPNFITKNGEILLTCDSQRSQMLNRKACIEKFYSLIQQALRPEKPRKKMKPSKAQKLKRLRDKKMQSIKKQRRSKNPDDF